MIYLKKYILYIFFRQDGDQFLPNVRSENGVLYVDVAVPENQGVYICQSTPYLNINPELIVLTVVPTTPVSPDNVSNITLSVNQLKIPTGGSGTIECNPHGYPSPLIKWTKVLFVICLKKIKVKQSRTRSSVSTSDKQFANLILFLSSPLTVTSRVLFDRIKMLLYVL